MIDGYSFADDQPVPFVCVDDVVTLIDIIKWGWTHDPELISDEPRREGEKYGRISHRDTEVPLRYKAAFKIGSWFYRLSSFNTEYDPRLSPYETDYWNKESNGIVNSHVVDIITAAMSAPVSNEYTHTPYYGHITTEGGERVGVTSWVHALKENKFDISAYFSTYEREGIPGIGYKHPPSTIHHDNPPTFEWPDFAQSGLYESQFTEFTVHFPNCEMGANTCIKFRIRSTTTRKIVTGPRGAIAYVREYESTFLRYHGFFFPENIRRMKLPRYQPRTTTNTVSCYVLNRQEEAKFVERISNKTISDQVKGFLYGDGSGSILGLKWFYGVRPSIATTQKRKITLGNYIIEDLTVPVFGGDFVQVYMGKVFVRGPFDDYRNYTDARYQMYIPMLGHVDLDPSRVVGKNVHLIYTVNLTDGSAVVTVATTEGTENLSNDGGWYETMNNIFTTSITYGYEIPLNVDSIKDVSTRVGEVTAKAVAGGAAGAIAGNVPGALLGAAAGVASAANPIQTTYSSGSLAPNSNVMGDFTPKIYVKFNKGTAGDISPAVGYPCGKIVKVADATGYLKAAMVYGTPSTTMQHTDEIVNMLKEGIFIS